MDIIEDFKNQKKENDTKIDKLEKQMEALEETENYFTNPGIITEIGRLTGERDKLTQRNDKLIDNIVDLETKQLDLEIKQLELEKAKLGGLGITQLIKFWKAALAFKVESLKENEVVELGQDTYFLGEVDYGSRLFVRESYLELLELVLNTRGDVLLRGIPGIGKTYFSFLLLLRLISEGKTVVYGRKKGEKSFLFSSKEVKSADYFTYFLEAKSKETFLILDAVDINVIGAKTILVSSPDEENFHEFVKKLDLNKGSYYMSPWSLEEIEVCNRKIYHRDVGKVKEGFEKVGGVPRILLEKESIDISSVISALNETKGFSLRELSWFLVDKSNFRVSSKFFKCSRALTFDPFRIALPRIGLRTNSSP